MGLILQFAGLAVGLLVVVILVRTIRLTSGQVQVEAAADVVPDRQELAGRLAQAVRFQTISDQDPAQANGEEFAALHDYLEKIFPRAHATLTREFIADYSCLYTWTGQDERLKPILLLAHLDVVPAGSGPEGGWTHPPFEGHIADGYVWGRGTLDDKGVVLGTLEAVEFLLAEGFQPRRTFYLAFGHDEEMGGGEGAAQIATLLQSRGVELEYVLDEGLAVTEGIVPSVSGPVAMVGIAEKGNLSLELTVDCRPGHSMMPPAHTSVGLLSAAIHKLERNQMPLRIETPTRRLFCTLAPEMSFAMRLVFANLWLFAGLVKRQLAASPATNALVRTTAAATIFEAGVKENILPPRARAVINVRILTGETIASVVADTRRTIDDPRVDIKPLGGFRSEPSFVSDTTSPSFESLVRTIRQVFPGVLAAPGLVLGSTDSRHYAALTKNIYRFSPIRVTRVDLDRIHGTDERISVEGYEQVVKFYLQLIRNSDSIPS